MIRRPHTRKRAESRHDVVARQTTGRRHKRMLLAVATTAVTLVAAGISGAGAASHNVTYSVVPTRTLSLSQSSTVGAGNIGRTATLSEIDGGTLIYTTDATGDKITVSSSAMEPNTTLKVSAGDIGTCTGTKGTLVTMPITLSTTAQNLITSVGTTGTGDCLSALTYELSTNGAAIASNVSKTVTYTIQAA